MVLVLYVDDEECLLDICQAFLARAGNIAVDTASSVDDGMRLVAEKEYDAIISDYEMPVRNGIDFLKTLRSQGNRTPFIIFTGRGREEIVIEAFDSGADFYLQKGGEPKSQFAELIHKVTMAVDRRKSERELENSNSLLKATLEATADGIIVVDSHGAISAFNQKFLQMWNLTDDAGSMKTENDFLVHIRDKVADYTAFVKPFEKIRQDPEAGSYDIVHCRDGQTFRRFSQVQKIHDRIVGRVWSFRDITGQNRTELELRAACEQLAATETELKKKYAELEMSTALLRESEEKYRAVFHTETYPILIIDQQSYGILDLNDAAAALYGYEREEMLTLTLCDLQSGTGQIPDGICEHSHELPVYYHQKKNTTIFPVEISASRFSIGSRPLFLIAVRDISRTKKIEEALRLSNVKLNLLLGITRHDINNKLSALSGYTEILRTQISDPHQVEMLAKQQKTCEAIAKQIDFTRDYDQFGIKTPGWHRIDAIAAQAYSLLSQTITFRCETGTLEIYADPMLEKVFYNLFDNAFRYGEGITRISLTWARAGEDLLLIVEDDGIGIAHEEKERIFRSGYGKNTGLGLYLTREILSLTGMTIAETGEYERGARFEIRVPDGNFRFLKPAAESQDFGNQQPIFADD